MQVPQVNFVRFKAFSYSILLAGFVWYSYWIAYDMFAWNKSLIQVNPLNYFGVTAILGLIAFETRIRPRRRFKRTVENVVMEQQVMALPLRIGECPYGEDYFDQADRSQEIPRRCIKCSNIIDCACRSSQNHPQMAVNNPEMN
jgi:hypothetical protein